MPTLRKQVKSGKKTLRVLIVGSKGRAIDLYKALQEQMVWGVTVVGFVDPDPSLTGTEVLGIPVIGTVDNIHDCLKNNIIDEVIIAIPRSLLNDAEPIVIACEEEGIRLRFMADIFNVQVARSKPVRRQGHSRSEHGAGRPGFTAAAGQATL